MRTYNHTHAFYGGLDLHARSLFTHILDQHGKTAFERNLPASPDAFLDAVAPFRQGLVVGCECMFVWYWLADLCEDDEIPFTLGGERTIIWDVPVVPLEFFRRTSPLPVRDEWHCRLT